MPQVVCVFFVNVVLSDLDERHEKRKLQDKLSLEFFGTHQIHVFKCILLHYHVELPKYESSKVDMIESFQFFSCPNLIGT